MRFVILAEFREWAWVLFLFPEETSLSDPQTRSREWVEDNRDLLLESDEIPPPVTDL